MVACNDCSVATKDQSQNPVFRKVLWIALLVNLLMFFVEIIASHVGDSMSLQADALDFFGDAANYAISLFVLGMALHLRARASVVKGLTMGLFGLWVIGAALYRVFIGSEPEPMIMGSIALMALVANMSVAVMLYRFRDGDSNMQSIWLCSRNDAIGNVAVLIAAVGVTATASRWPDLVVAMIIASLSLSAAYTILKLAFQEMRVTSEEPAISQIDDSCKTTP
ncbi:cation diffusion facilitator family transporter [Arenicella sp. 4NH20-0111]|uniref:cation diffusion facilitator family transporter n=1 Tax=Arenicella sp. 4NH20-0111 TaxID=3127648 RepID=UPI003105F728